MLKWSVLSRDLSRTSRLGDLDEPRLLLKGGAEMHAGMQTNQRAAAPADYAVKAVYAIRTAFRMQSLVAGALALGLLLVGPVAAYSSLCGSLAVYVPGMLFAVLLGRKIGADSATFLRTAVLAEFGKLLLTGLSCVLVFVWVRPLAAQWFFAGMVAGLVTGWIGLAKAIR